MFKTVDEKLSVVIPYYNGFHYIENFIFHILQIKHLKEIIIVDDSSPDNLNGELNLLFKNEAKVKIYRKENSGVASSRNYGLAKVSGEYVAFVDQDDDIVADTFDKAIKVLDNTSVPCVLWSTSQNIKYAGVISPLSVVLREGLVTEEVLRTDFITSLILDVPNTWITCLGQVWGGMYRVSFLQEKLITFFKFIEYEDDKIFIFQVLLNAKMIVLIKDIGYHWIVHQSSYSHVPHSWDNYLKKYNNYYNYIIKELERFHIEGSIIVNFDNFIRQKMVIDLTYNCCKKTRSIPEMVKILKELFCNKSFKDAYEKPCMLQGRFYTVAFRLIKNRLFYIVAMLFKIVYERSIKKRDAYIKKEGRVI